MFKDLFIPASNFLIRSPIWTQEKADNLLLKENWVEAVFQLYENEPLVQEAMLIASPGIVDALNKGKTPQLAATLFKYMLRMAKRPTPFGLFSYIISSNWSEKKLEVDIDPSQIKKKVRPDMTWVFFLLENHCKNKALFQNLSIYLNPLIQKKASRYLLSYLRNGSVEMHANQEVSTLKETPLISLIFKLVQKPIQVSVLCKKLIEAIPALELQKVNPVIEHLLSKQFVLPALLPSLLKKDVFIDLYPYLDKRDDLEGIQRKMDLYKDVPIGKGKESLENLSKEMHSLASCKETLQVDAYYEKEISLPSSIGEEMCESAAMLWALSPRKSMGTAIQVYHDRFMEKYGTHRTVAILDLIDEQKGLGPFNLNNTVHKAFSNPLKAEWERWLYREWEKALINKDEEIVLTQKLPAQLRNLAGEKPLDPKDALPSLDLFFKISAQNTEDIQNGNYLLEFVQPSWHGASAIGRFFYLFNDEQIQSYKEYFSREEQLEENCIFLEVSGWPKTGYNANVSNHPCLRKHHLDLQDTTGNSFSLKDIFVGATGGRLYLTTKDGGKEIIYRTSNFLNSVLMPNAFQLIREITLTRFQLLHPLSWGILEDKASYLPRIRYKKTILSPAQWHLDPALLQGNDWQKKFNKWADCWMLPERTLLVQRDRQLLIDRRHPGCLKEIQLKAKKNESIKFIEELKQSWFKGSTGSYSVEIALPVLKNKSYSNKSPLVPLPNIPISEKIRLRMPENDWLYMKIYLTENEIPFFLKTEIPHLIRKGYEFYFIRYADPNPHLRLRLRVNSHTKLFYEMNIIASNWISMGVVQQIAWHPYEREIERYGGALLIEYAEKVFCEDSLHVLQKLVANQDHDSVQHTLTSLVFLKGFGLSIAEIHSILNKTSKRSSALAGFRKYKNTLIAQSEKILQETKLDSAKEKFREMACTLSLNQQHDIYNSMLHMHFNRLGCTLFEESRARIYAFSLLLHLDRIEANSNKLVTN